MSNLNVYGDISPRTGGKAKKKLLERGQHLLVTERFGTVDPLGKNQTKTVKFRRYNSLPRATAPLAEGIPPAGRKLTYEDITMTLEWYGDFVEITDVIADTHEDAVLKETMKLCGEQAAETIEEIRINFLKAGTNVFYANGVASRSLVDSPPVRGDFRKIFRSFKNNKAREITEIIKPSPLISTQAIEPGYFCMGHTDLKADIRDIPGFVPVTQYADPGKRLPGEVGAIEEFRIILTAMFEPWEQAGASGTTYLSGGQAVSVAAPCDVYPLIFVARNSYAIVPLQGFNVAKIAVRNPNNPTKDDPLGQKGFGSWKVAQTGGILNQLWVARLECAATANPT
jgi:N4-gp56 family major capsid protein